MLMFTASTSFPPPPPGGPFPDEGGNIPSRMKYCIYTVYTISTVCQGGGKKFFWRIGKRLWAGFRGRGPAGNSPQPPKAAGPSFRGADLRLARVGEFPAPSHPNRAGIPCLFVLYCSKRRCRDGTGKIRGGAAGRGELHPHGRQPLQGAGGAGGQAGPLPVPGGAGPLPPHRGDLPGVPGAGPGGYAPPDFGPCDPGAGGAWRGPAPGLGGAGRGGPHGPLGVRGHPRRGPAPGDGGGPGSRVPGRHGPWGRHRRRAQQGHLQAGG